MIYDVSVRIANGMAVWPSDPPLKLTPIQHLSRDKSHTVHVTNIEMGSHTGTHLDAPYHFVAEGWKLDEIPLDVLVGPVTVVQIEGVSSITRSQLQNLVWDGVQRVFFKTENSEHWKDGVFYEDFVYLEPDAAEFLVQQGIRLVGIDYLSIDPYKSLKHPSHFVLLLKNVIVIEGLDLSQVQPGLYAMVALPLNLAGADGAPTRVILIGNG
ncbi:MAG TPA: cyclase family protein [Terriglobia bacterium]|nr:cyclase family protein [Terriglobia bacterium]